MAPGARQPEAGAAVSAIEGWSRRPSKSSLGFAAVGILLWCGLRVASAVAIGRPAGDVWLEATFGCALDALEFLLLTWCATRLRRGRALVWAWVAASAGLRVLDLVHAGWFGAHPVRSSLMWLEPSMFDAYVRSGGILIVAMAAAVAWFSARAMAIAARRGALGPWSGRESAIAFVVLMAHAVVGVDAQHAAATPLERLSTAARAPAPAQWLSDEAAQRLAHFGIGPAAARPARPSAEPPRWIVWVLVESMDVLAARKMPAMATLAQAEGASFVGVRASARPTHHALLAWMCGLPPATFPHDTVAPRLGDHVRCLPELLAAAGYETVVVQGAPLRFTGLGEALQRYGFSRREGQRALSALGDLPRGPWGVSDRSLFSRAVHHVDQARAGGRRVFVLVVTSDTHTPGAEPVDCPADARSSGANPSTWARALRCTDDALVSLHARLRERGLATEGQWLVTGDHPAPPLPGVARSLGASPPPFGPLPFWRFGVGVRRGEVRSVVAGSIDAGVTVAGWAGLADRIGHGMPFGDRPSDHWLLASGDVGRIGWRAGGDDREGDGPLGGLVAACERGEDWPGLQPAAPDPCDVLDLLQASDAGYRRAAGPSDDSAPASATVLPRTSNEERR